MGWKGTWRSIQAASRRMEREAQRQRRELKKQELHYAKMEALEQARYEAEVYENRLEVLLSIHKDCGEVVDWHSFIEKIEPEKPIYININESKARQCLDKYTPGFFARLFGLEKRQRNSLIQRVHEAQEEDRKLYEEKSHEWKMLQQDWRSKYELASRIIAGDIEAKIDAIREIDPFSDISELGSSIKFKIGSTGIIESNVYVHGDKVIPVQSKSLLKSGKLSIKKLSISKRNELLQDYICSCVMRIGRELLCIIPDDIVIVTAKDDILNSSTGHTDVLPILSVAFSRKTLEKININNVDPSDAMKNFVHNMSFKKTSGFSSVNSLNPEQFI